MEAALTANKILLEIFSLCENSKLLHKSLFQISWTW